MRLLPKDTEHGWTPYLWLVYLGPYVVFPFVVRKVTLFGDRTLTLVVWAAGLGAFLTLYFRSYWIEGSARLRLVLLLGLLGAALAPRNPGALMFFTYAAGFVGGAARPSHAGLWIGGLTVAGVLSALTTPWQPYLMLSGVAITTPLIGFVNLHHSENRRRDAALRLANDEIARLATVAERERIAGELHDLLGHTLSVIVLKSELATKLVATNPARAAEEMRAVETVSREALAEVRRAVQGFRASTIADEIVRARAVLESAGVHVDVEGELPPRHDQATTPAAREREHAIAMILREAVTNVVRHANATRCRVSAHAGTGEFVLQIEDDGKGAAIVEGAGISGMRARAREVGGTLQHRSQRGVTVTVRVPWNAHA